MNRTTKAIMAMTIAAAAMAACSKAGAPSVQTPDGPMSPRSTETLKRGGELCAISGQAPTRLNDVWVYLVPMQGARSENVDSVTITDGKFAFVTDTMMMAKVVVDYHYRMDVEELLVVAEPGNVSISIDSVSTAGGTRQNDSLELWKRDLQRTMPIVQQMRREARQKEADSIYIAHKNRTRQMAQSLTGTLLGEFLSQRYPTTYKERLPDGTTIIYNADTHEPIN